MRSHGDQYINDVLAFCTMVPSCELAMDVLHFPAAYLRDHMSNQSSFVSGPLSKVERFRAIPRRRAVHPLVPLKSPRSTRASQRQSLCSQFDPRALATCHVDRFQFTSPGFPTRTCFIDSSKQDRSHFDRYQFSSERSQTVRREPR